MQIAATPNQYATYHPEGIAAREAAEMAEFTFLDLVDVVNPLQHIPLVNVAYREATGDTIKGPAMIVGGFLFGGPAGMGIGMVNAVALHATGGTVSDHMLDGVLGGNRVRPVPTDQLYALFGHPNADPATADLLATAHRAPTAAEIQARTVEIAALARGLGDPATAGAGPTQAELAARTAQVAALARQLDRGPPIEGTSPGMAMAAAPPPAIPRPPSVPDRPARAAHPSDPALIAAATPVAAPAAAIHPASPIDNAVEPAGPTPAAAPAVAALDPAPLVLDLSAPVGTAIGPAQVADVPLGRVPPPPEAFMPLPARVPATPSRMMFQDLPPAAGGPASPHPGAAWLAQDVIASADSPLSESPTVDPAANRPTPGVAAAPGEDDGAPAAGDATAIPLGAVPAAIMRNLDAYQRMARSAG